MALTFRGGIYPPCNKVTTENLDFVNLPIPQFCYIPMLQHIGIPAKPVVSVGSMVTEGQLIGAADGFNSANVHASVPGKVIEIIELPVGKKKHLLS